MGFLLPIILHYTTKPHSNLEAPVLPRYKDAQVARDGPDCSAIHALRWRLVQGSSRFNQVSAWLSGLPSPPITLYYGKIPTTGICKGPGFRCLELLVCLGDMGVLGVEVCAAVVGGAIGGSRRSYRGLDVKLQRPLVLIRKVSTLPR